MIINVCILAPLTYTVISLAADSLICFLDPMAGNSIIKTVTSASGELYDILSTVNDEANFKVLTTGELVSGYMLNIINWILIFLVGSLYFKKNKVGKTFLVVILVSMVIGSLSTWIFLPFANTGLIETLNNAENLQHAMDLFKVSTFSISVIETAGLMIWTYIRVRTVKH